MLYFNVAERKMTHGKLKGGIGYYAKREVKGVMTLRQVEEEIVQKTSLAKGDVRNAIASLAEVVNSALLSGLKVDLGDLGSFSVEAYGKVQETPELVNAHTVKKPQIRYNPKTDMRKYAQSVPITVKNPKDKGSTDNSADAGESPSVPGVRPGHSL